MVTFPTFKGFLRGLLNHRDWRFPGFTLSGMAFAFKWASHVTPRKAGAFACTDGEGEIETDDFKMV